MLVRTNRRRLLVLLGLGATALALGLAFMLVGLDTADKLASVAGAFIGLAGLAIAVYSALDARSASRQSSPRTGTDDPFSYVFWSTQKVSGGKIGGNNIQIGHARDVDLDVDTKKP